MNLSSPSCELVAVINLCGGVEEIKEYFMGHLKYDFFGVPVIKDIYKRVMYLVTVHNKLIPTIQDLKTDLSLSEDSRKLFKNYKRFERVKTVSRAKLLVERLNQYRKIRLIYDCSQKTIEIMQKDKVDVDIVLGYYENVLEKSHTSIDMSDELLHIGKNGNASSIIRKLLDGEAMTFISTGFEQFDKINGGFGLGSLISIAASTSGGKAQPLYCKVKIPNGWVTMGDVKLGQEVCTPDGKTAKVTHIFPQGIKDVYKITLLDGRSTECCKDHLWKVYSKLTDSSTVIPLKEFIDFKYDYTIPVFNTGNVSIKSIEYVGKEECQCIVIDNPDSLYITDDFIVTHNSVWVAMTANYQLHRFLKLPNPSHYFKILKNTMLHMIFVAITYKQAADTLWEPFRSYYDDSPWFKEYHKMLDYYGEKVGKPFYDIKATYIRYDHKKLTAYALGPDKRKLRGRTCFFDSVDELGWFHGADKAVKLNPDEICKALENSLQTLRSACEIKRDRFNIVNCPDALFVNISSPSAANDKIMRLVRESASNRYVFHLPTWEMNPMITRKSLEPRFRDNPISAERDFGANPPLSDSPYISNPETVRNIIRQEVKNRCKYSTVYSQDSLKHTTLKVKNFIMKDLDRSINYVLGIDTGHSKNSFAIVLQHYDCSSKCAMVDLALEVRPQDGFTVHFPAMFDMVIKPITDKARVALVVFDKWQSINYEDELHDLGIEADRYSLKHEDFVSIRGYFFSMKVILPRPELDFEEIINPIKEYPKFLEGKPISHLIYQMLTVRDLGRMVTKGLGVDDDLFRAWCLGVKYLFDPKWEKVFHLPAINRKGKKALGVIVGKSIGIQPTLNYGISKGSMDVVLGTVRSCKGMNKIINSPKFNTKNY